MKWEDKSLDELGFVSRGRSRYRPRDAEHLYGGIYPFIQTSDVKHSGLYINSFSQTYSEEGLAQSKLWKAGTLCITIAANIADTAILEIDACFPDSIIGFIPDPNKADVRFIKYLFDAQLQRRFKQFTQGAAQDNLSQSKLLSLKLPVPSINIQNKIADILSRYDEAIANNRRRIELLERSSRLLYREWFVYLRFPGHEHGAIGSDGIPEGWERRKITDLCIVTDGTHDSPKASDTGYFLVTGKHIINGFIDFSKCYLISDDDHKQVMQRSKPEKGDVIFSNIGTLGSTVLVDQDFEFSIKNVALFKPKSREKYSAFLYFYFSDPWTLSYMEGQSLGTSQKFFSLKLLRGLEITVPSKLILTTFNDFVVSLLQQRTLLHSTNQKLQAARDLLLPRLMNGEINV